ncbi:voltage-gated potassium channel [Aureococcus anophagefferens]|nr:voltage-gated potassium channel [Aureococcus anophagefferens]
MGRSDYEALEERAWGGRGLLAVVGGLAVGGLANLAAIGGTPYKGAMLALESFGGKGARSSPAQLSNATDESVVTTTVYAADLLKIDSVCEWIESYEGVDKCTSLSDEKLYKLVPKRMVFETRKSFVRGSIGDDAEGGYLTFNMVMQNRDNTFDASWLVVCDVYGNIETMEPLYQGKEFYRAAGLKMYSDAEVLFAAGESTSLNGYVYLFDWKAGTYARHGDKKVDIHDLQRAYSGDYYWALDSKEYGKVDVANGAWTIGPNEIGVAQSEVDDLNHIQLIEDDKYAILSSRSTNTIYKVKADSGDEVWALGGDLGDFTITGIDGTEYEAGHSYWHGQHNAEYIGNDEYAMFDNNFDYVEKGSKLLVVKLDEDGGNATVVFEYSTGTYSMVFGDNDKLPTTNMLGCWWPSSYYTSSDYANAKVVEVVRDTSDIAFELDIYNDVTCEADSCDVEEGWLMYSVERFYTKPLVYGLACAAGDDDGAYTLTATTMDTHKMASKSPGSYVVEDAKGATIASGTFDFDAHWNPTALSVDVTGLTSGEGTLKVTNKYDSVRSYDFTC